MNRKSSVISVLLLCSIVLGCLSVDSCSAETIYDDAKDIGNLIGDLFGAFIPKDIKLKCNDETHSKIYEKLHAEKSGWFFCVCPSPNAKQGKCKTMVDKMKDCANPKYSAQLYASLKTCDRLIPRRAVSPAIPKPKPAASDLMVKSSKP